MKKIVLLFCLCASPILAQSNYFALVSSNTYIHGISRADFRAGNAQYSDTTNLQSSVTGLAGYLYPSNFSGLTRWEFNPRIIINTNAFISFNLLTTNTATVLAGTYKVQLWTNNCVAPYFDSGDVVWIAPNLAPNNTNIMVMQITNLFPNAVMTNSAVRTNLLLGTFSVKVGPVAGQWYPLWITGGQIRF